MVQRRKNRSRRNRLTELGELQMQVLEILWELEEGTVYEVQEQFPEPDRPKYTTLLTVLRSLEQKGLATHRTEEQTYVFQPQVQRQDLQRNILHDVLGRVFSGSLQDMVAALLDTKEATPEVLAEMKALIAAREEEVEDEQ